MAADPGVVVGRDPEIGRLREAVVGVAGGRGRCVWIEGEPGIGKSTLLRVGLEDAERLGCQVAWGAADELSQRFPLHVMLDCLAVDARSPDPRRAEAAALLGGAGPGAVAASGGDPVVAAVERLLGLVDRLCATAPLVLVVDDLQWADEASLLMCHRLARALHQEPLLLVGACRPVPRRAEVAQLRRALRSRGAELVSLGPLGAGEVDELVGKLVGAAPGSGLLTRVGRAAGNPLYVCELVDGLLREGAVRVRDGVADLADGSTGSRAPASLTAVIADRLGFLSAEAHDVLRLASLLGGDFAVTDLAVVAARPASALVGALEEATAAGVMVEAGVRLRFRHPLIRQALYERMPVAVRGALHRQAAQALAEAGAPVERVAEQLLLVPEAADTWMLDWLTGAAPELLHRAPQVAAELLERAVAHAPAEDARWEVLAGCLAAAAFVLARHERLERVTRRVLARTGDAKRAAEMSWLLAYTLARTGRLDEGLTTTSSALGRPEVDAGWKARLRALEALIFTADGSYEAAERAAVQALSEGERLGDRLAIGYALHARSMTSLQKRDLTGCLAHIERALALLGEDPETADLCVVLRANQVVRLSDLDRGAQAEAAVQQARALAERLGSPRIGQIHLMAAEHYFYVAGRWDDAVAELEAVADLPETQSLPLVLHGLGALIAGHRDDRSAAAAHLRALEDQELPTMSAAARGNVSYLLMARALAAERDGRPELAVDVLAQTLRPDYAEDLAECYPWLPDLVRLALAVEDRGTAEAAAAACAAEAAEGGRALVTAAADRCRGLLAADPAPLLAAADYYRGARRPLELGKALEDAAVLLAGRGDPAAARTAAAEALEVYASLGAAWDIRRMDARLRVHGIRRGATGPRRRARTGWAALTPTEVRVARLVAEGGSNPDIAAELFLSRRTVQTHVSHILAKLGARSRSEVAREATREATRHLAIDPRGDDQAEGTSA